MSRLLWYECNRDDDLHKVSENLKRCVSTAAAAAAAFSKENRW
jgi:hypothetical protein